MDPVTAGALVSGAASVFNTGANWWNQSQNRKQSEANLQRQIKANRQMAELNWQKNLEQWNRENLYNSPEQQMQRFREAGLNPNLVATQGSSGNAQGSPTYEQQAADYSQKQARRLPTMPNLTAMYQDVKTKHRQADQIKELTRLAVRNAELARAKQFFTEKQQEQLEKVMGFNLDTAKYRSEIAQSQASMEAEKSRRFKEFQDQQYDKLVSEVKIMQSQAEYRKLSAKLKGFGLDTNDDSVAKMLAVFAMDNGYYSLKDFFDSMTKGDNNLGKVNFENNPIPMGMPGNLGLDFMRAMNQIFKK